MSHNKTNHASGGRSSDEEGLDEVEREQMHRAMAESLRAHTTAAQLRQTATEDEDLRLALEASQQLYDETMARDLAVKENCFPDVQAYAAQESAAFAATNKRKRDDAPMSRGEGKRVRRRPSSSVMFTITVRDDDDDDVIEVDENGAGPAYTRKERRAMAREERRAFAAATINVDTFTREDRRAMAVATAAAAAPPSASSSARQALTEALTAHQEARAAFSQANDAYAKATKALRAAAEACRALRTSAAPINTAPSSPEASKERPEPVPPKKRRTFHAPSSAASPEPPKKTTKTAPKKPTKKKAHKKPRRHLDYGSDHVSSSSNDSHCDSDPTYEPPSEYEDEE